MITVDTKVFILRLFILTCYSFFIAYSLIPKSKIKVRGLILLFLINFILKLLIGNFADVIILLIISVLSKLKNKKVDIQMNNAFLISFLFVGISSLLVGSSLLFFIPIKNTIGIVFILIEETLVMILCMVGITLFRRSMFINNFFDKEDLLLCSVLSYLYLVLLFFITMINNFNAYEHLINMFLLFVIIQSLFTYIIFLKDRKKREQKYEDKLFRSQLESLKDYTEYLESDSRSVRKFKHDYKNILLSLRISVENKQYDDIENFLNQLDDYSNLYFSSSNIDVFKDLNNITNSYLKSVFINKLQVILNKNMNCHFECRDTIDSVYIDMVDMIRMISIILDNSIEAGVESVEKQINIVLVENKSELIVKIENSHTNNQETLSKLMKMGYSTKKNHSGLGLTNIQDIRNKYSNVFVQYEQSESFFSVKLIINKEGEI